MAFLVRRNEFLRRSQRCLALQHFSSLSSDRAAAREARRAARLQPHAIEGSVPYYERHFMVVDAYGNAEEWPKKLEMSDHVVATYSKAVNEFEAKRGSNAKESPLMVTAAIPFGISCQSNVNKDGHINEEDQDSLTKHDVLVLPDMLRLHNITVSQVPDLVKGALEHSKNFQQMLEQRSVSYSDMEGGYHMFVCAHTNRDFRCGCAGPKLLGWLREISTQENLPVHLYSASHYGGHRYAGNCIVYPSGDWFGMLNSKDDAQALIRASVEENPLSLAEQWRGRIELTKEQQIQLVKQTIPKESATPVRNEAGEGQEEGVLQRAMRRIFG